jgi:hypothetical protein
MTTARDLQERLQQRLARPSQQSGSSSAAGRWLRVSVDLPPDVHEALTRFAFEHGRVKVMHLGQALFEFLLEDEELQRRVLVELPRLRRKSDSPHVST